MKDSLKARRQKLLRELDRVNRRILSTQKNIAQLQSQIAGLRVPTAKAA